MQRAAGGGSGARERGAGGRGRGRGPPRCEGPGAAGGARAAHGRGWGERGAVRAEPGSSQGTDPSAQRLAQYKERAPEEEAGWVGGPQVGEDGCAAGGAALPGDEAREREWVVGPHYEAH